MATAKSTRRVSIALATYNGGRFLAEQLESFLTQTRLPDELIVGDDGSSDDTVAILEQFASRAPFPVRITRNSANLGPTGNFVATVLRCTGQVVFFCDQDDIWRPAKLERMLAYLDANPDIFLAVHDAALVDGQARPLGPTMGEQISASGGNPARALVAGCCMAIDARLLTLYNPPPAITQHDAWLAALAQQFGLRGYLDEPLIDYRRHGDNVSESYMSNPRKPGRWSRLSDRWRAARKVPVRRALEQAIASREAGIAAVRRNRPLLHKLVGEERVDTVIAEQMVRLRKERDRLAIHTAPRLSRPLKLVRALLSPTYRGPGSGLSLLRDLSEIHH